MLSTTESLAETGNNKLPYLAWEIKSGLDLAEKGKQDRIKGLVDAAIATSTARAPRKAASQAPKRQARDLPCPICHFKTEPHHDGRMHRSQRTKKPFTTEDLMERHLTKVG
jgi:hypothetical protein